jgi:hypothetical protein
MIPDLRLWNAYMAENRRANVAYAENPFALSDCCDADDRRRITNKRTLAWRREAQRKERAQLSARRVGRIHGRTGYNYGCRCDVCRHAASEYRRTRPINVHGVAGYNAGCRCDDICRPAKSDYQRRALARKLQVQR